MKARADFVSDKAASESNRWIERSLLTPSTKYTLYAEYNNKVTKLVDFETDTKYAVEKDVNYSNPEFIDTSLKNISISVHSASKNFILHIQGRINGEITLGLLYDSEGTNLIRAFFVTSWFTVTDGLKEIVLLSTGASTDANNIIFKTGFFQVFSIANLINQTETKFTYQNPTTNSNLLRIKLLRQD